MVAVDEIGIEVQKNLKTLVVVSMGTVVVGAEMRVGLMTADTSEQAEEFDLKDWRY